MQHTQLLRHHVSYLRSRPRICKAAMHALDGALQRKDNQGISLELFLCGLYFVFGKQFLRQFDDPSAFLQMQQELLPEGNIGAIVRWWRRYKSIPRDQFVFAKYEDRLTGVLWNATRISRATGIRSNGLPELLAALCLDEEAIHDLKSRWRFMPRQYLEPLISPQQPSGTSA
jgi:hypothetical protein